MTYLVLARKWRPRSFETLVGQDHVVKALTHALSTQRLHHAWLFTGTRGVGKTTLSRLLAKSLNCETGITPTPCGHCRACVEIDNGRFVDYVELDAASNRGVDEMTQLLEQAVYAPGAGRFKVYMIDEVHMLTGHAFNAMLKTLEEPPPHVKFILATTDPQKIPVTVLSRCLQFNLKQMTAESIVGHLQHVLAEENIPAEVPALRLIAQAASGSMRDALSLTDQAIAYSAGNLSAEAVQGMLGTIDQRYLVRLLDGMAAGMSSVVVEVAEELASRGLSYTGALADLSVLLSRVAIEQRVPGTTPPDDPLSQDIVRLGQVLASDVLQLFYTVAVHSRAELALAPDEYAGFIMACLRMLSLAPVPTPPDPGSKAAPEPVSGNSESTPVATPSLPRGGAPEPVRSQAPSLSAESAQPLQAASRPTGPAPISQAPKHPPEHSAIAAPLPSDVEPPAWEDAPQSDTEAVAGRSAQADVGSTAPQSSSPTLDAPRVDQSSPLTPATHATSQPLSSEPAVPPAELATNESDDDFETMGMPSDEPVWLDDDGSFVDSVPDEILSGLAAAPEDDVAVHRTVIQSPRLLDMTAKDWPALAAHLPATGLAAELARQSEWVGVDGQVIHLRVAVRTLADTLGKARLCTLLSEHFGTVVKLDVEFGETGDDTAHAVQQARRAALQKAAEAAVQEDAFVQTLVREFDARVLPGSVRPADERAA